MSAGKNQILKKIKIMLFCLLERGVLCYLSLRGREAKSREAVYNFSFFFMGELSQKIPIHSCLINKLVFTGDGASVKVGAIRELTMYDLVKIES